MKKYILSLLVLIATLSANSQIISVYKNGGTTPVAAYINSATDKYEVVLKEDTAVQLFVKITSSDIDTLKAIKVKTDQNIDGENREKVLLVPEGEQIPSADGTIYTIEIPVQKYAFYTIYLSKDGTTYKEAMASKNPSGWGRVNSFIDIDYERNAVQLWPDGPYFSTMNVGETTETACSQKYKWGATSAGGGQYNGDYDLEHDTAYKIWGSAWRMVTMDEWRALKRNCSISHQLAPDMGFTLKNKSNPSDYPPLFIASGTLMSWNHVRALHWSSTLDCDFAYCVEFSGRENGTKFITDDPSRTRIHDCYVRAILR